MAVTDMGKLYARRIWRGEITMDDVPKRRRQDAYDSYLEMNYSPVIEQPQV